MTSVARVSPRDGDSVVCAPGGAQGGPAGSEHHAQSFPHHTSPLQHSGGVRAERYVLRNRSHPPDNSSSY
jgi:hypothetical protein